MATLRVFISEQMSRSRSAEFFAADCPSAVRAQRGPSGWAIRLTLTCRNRMTFVGEQVGALRISRTDCFVHFHAGHRYSRAQNVLTPFADLIAIGRVEWFCGD